MSILYVCGGVHVGVETYVKFLYRKEHTKKCEDLMF